MRRAVKMLETYGFGHKGPSRMPFCTVACLSAIISMGAQVQASSPAQAQTTQGTKSALPSPVNHEVGRIEQVIAAEDDGYRFRAYVLTWRSMRIVVPGAPDQTFAQGDNLDVLVFRSALNGHGVLRFEANFPAANENDVDRDSANSSASVTLGTARIEDSVSADSDGYRFVGYFVTWHGQRVFVVDPLSAPTRASGETINFRVFRTGLGTGRRLSFSL